MYLEIVTPDEKVFEGEVESATFPASDGSFQVLADHAPMISTLGTGDIKLIQDIDKKTQTIHFKVIGGVVEVLNNKVMVLAEKIETA
ncbi:MAG: F-type H+-transporting ATPase subunit epsilon [Marinoscillum sp.]|jgi:F-type H+-transporting ATPase subunit epsilon